MEVMVDLSAMKEVEPVKKVVKKTAKRKIDFNPNVEKVRNTRVNVNKTGVTTTSSVDMKNNNSNATKINDGKMCTRARTGCDKAKTEMSRVQRVQWTQEFLDKVHKSNEKY